MDFKIDTKDTFSTIMPIGDIINEKLADELREKCNEVRQRGSKNLIIDFQQCNAIEKSAIKDLLALHEESYGQDQSFVLTGINRTIMTTLKEDESDLLLNIAPKMDEAIDLIGMEILERDLFSEES